jgi:predicted GNAT family acetyltransferase
MTWFGNKEVGNKKRAPTIVTTGRFELERDGHVATLDYTVAGHVLALLHTEIPKQLRNTGIASTLAKTALDWAREHHMKIDVVCPFVAGYLGNHPEYSDLVLR